MKYKRIANSKEIISNVAAMLPDIVSHYVALMHRQWPHNDECLLHLLDQHQEKIDTIYQKLFNRIQLSRPELNFLLQLEMSLNHAIETKIKSIHPDLQLIYKDRLSKALTRILKPLSELQKVPAAPLQDTVEIKKHPEQFLKLYRGINYWEIPYLMHHRLISKGEFYEGLVPDGSNIDYLKHIGSSREDSLLVSTTRSPQIAANFGQQNYISFYVRKNPDLTNPGVSGNTSEQEIVLVTGTPIYGVKLIASGRKIDL